jgi:4'-phosphopantetheinyl transferase
MSSSRLSNVIDVWRLDLSDRTWNQAPTPRRDQAAVQSQRAWRGARHVLAQRLKTPPYALRFEHGQAGKPRLADGSLQFNIAHSGDLALIALSPAPVGVDLERALPIESGLDALAQSILHGDELADWRAAPVIKRPSLFYSAWVRKEAYLKLTGLGLAKPMADLRIVDHGGDMAVSDAGRATPGPGGHVRDLEIAAGYAAAVCAPRAPSAVLVHTLPVQQLIDSVTHD